jgi:hypothetical protein
VSNREWQAIADQRRQVVRDQYDRFRTSYAGAWASLDTRSGLGRVRSLFSCFTRRRW